MDLPDWDNKWSEDDGMRLTKVEHRTRWLRGEMVAIWVVVSLLVLAVAAGTFFR